MLNSKKWGVSLLILTLVTLIFLGSITAVIDPFFHYHKPLDSLEYPLDGTRERYLNDGIVKHFDYDAIITGTSEAENFLASECDDLFGVSTVKVAFSGATYAELNNNLRRAIEANPDLRLVVFALDNWYLNEERGAMRTDSVYPEYLYDRDPFNDVNYLLNKEILAENSIGVLEYTRDGGVSTNFDDYSFWGNWGGLYAASRENALANSPRQPRADGVRPLTEADARRVVENLTENAVRLAEENPDIAFYYFFPPYSILTWDGYSQSGTLDRELEIFRLATETLLGIKNIHLFSFFDEFEMITDLDNYKDSVHYSPEINSWILRCLRYDEHRLTEDNYEAHWQAVADYYKSYDYDSIYE